MHTVTRTGSRPAKASDGSARGKSPVPAATRVAVAGATGYTGQELLRLLGRHPAVTITAAMSSRGGTAGRRLPALARIWDGEIVPLPSDRLAETADVMFLALPDKAAADIAPSLIDAGVRVIDLSGAFRLRDAAARARWYPETHIIPPGAAYGLTELDRAKVRGARLVANPGCYPTAALLALAPLVEARVLLPDADIIVDAKSGVSGAGKTPTERTHFSECHGSLSAYGVFNHRHAAEIEQGLGTAAANLTFTPHLVPLDRGLMATIYVRVAPGTTEDTLADVYASAYGNEPFVRLTAGALPEIKHVAYTNFCDIGWRIDRSGRAILVSVIDNLLKGASGQAVQNMNVMLGLDDRMGLL
jgi:N-acetyl-gamma-glutamyl-phosphate reductase